jgi:hypothetical protein
VFTRYGVNTAIALGFVPDPSSTTRPVRESLLAEAGYGCVLCGTPIVRFPSGSAGELVLCPDHSRLYESGEIDSDAIAKSVALPFNLAHPAESGVLRVSSKYPVARFKGVIVVNDELVVSADEETLLRLRIIEGRLIVSLRLYDAADVLKAEILDNEWVLGDPQEVLIDHSSNKLAITYRTGTPILTIDANRAPLQLAASLSRNGVPILMGSKGISVGDRVGSFIDDGYAGCVIDIVTETGKVIMTPDPRHGGHSIIVTERDPFQRVVKALNAMASLRSHVEDDPLSHI